MEVGPALPTWRPATSRPALLRRLSRRLPSLRKVRGWRRQLGCKWRGHCSSLCLTKDWLQLAAETSARYRNLHNRCHDSMRPYYSEPENIRMPGGFENSAMKTSFSLSSLQPSSVSLESPEHAGLHGRPYSSLRKKPRRDPEQDVWRRSWGSWEDNKDEFWAALKNNYQYLMDNNLIDSCKEARRDLQVCSPLLDWSFQHLVQQFTELDTWLSSIQEAVYSKQETVIDRNLRLSHMEEMQRNAYKRKLFNGQSSRLVSRQPELKEEVSWRVHYLNSKWDRLEQTVTPRKRTRPDHLDVCIDVEHELCCLRKWIKETEKLLKPLDFRAKWTLPELEVKAKEIEVVQRDVEAHGKIVCSVVKLCERICCGEGQAEGGEGEAGIRFARGLQKRWQLLFLRSLEWQCHVEQLVVSHTDAGPLTTSPTESDEEPVTKHPRLSQECWSPQSTSTIQDASAESDCLMETTPSLEAAEMVVGGTMEVVETDGTKRNLQATPLIGGYKDKTERFVLLRRQSIPPDAVRKLFPDELAMFNRSTKSGPNCAIYYYKHLDTDSEQDGVLAETETKSMDGASSEEEDEWTYTNGTNGDLTESTANNISSSSETMAISTEEAKRKDAMPSPEDPLPRAPARCSKEAVWRKLAKQAEQMVREEASSSPVRKASPAQPRNSEPLTFTEPGSKAKYSRVKEWLYQDAQLEKTVGDSCDASGEYTTEDDDQERHSEEMNTSSAAYCQHTAELIDSELDTTLTSAPPTLVPNTPEHAKGILRPKRAEGGVRAARPWSVSGSPGTALESRLPHSISESALHLLSLARMPVHCTSVKLDGSMQGTLSSSTTIEETSGQALEGGGSGGGYSSNSLRRRKVKLRKRNLGRKSESGSEGITPVDPPQQPASPHRRVPVATATSGTETEEESEEGGRLRRKVGDFRLGPGLGAVSSYQADKGGEKLVSADSSYSEQAWDNYQEKYMSEAYSDEPPDSEGARRLMEFGDDYRNYIDSQSDCASSLGRPELFRRRRLPAGDGLAQDSDSDLEDIRNVLHQSNRQFIFFEQVFNRQLVKASPQLVLASDFAEIGATCRDNVRCLKVLLENIEGETALMSAQECQDIRVLMERWETLKTRTEDLQRVRSLQREICSLKDELLELANRVAAMENDLTDRDQLEFRIQQIKGQLSTLRDRKAQLLEVNVAVHRFLTDTGHPVTVLKDDVADLYRVWDETFQRVSQQLTSLQQLSLTWQQLEADLCELQSALRGDHETLRMLDSALQGGSVSPAVATSVRDVAKVLSEKQDAVCCLNAVDGTLLSTEGSLSDSGISDSGSEQDLSERERRLATLRRLVRQLEAVLAPGSAALDTISKRIEQTESELRELQQTCRDLIVRTAVCAEARVVRKTALICSAPSPAQRQASSARRKKCGHEGDGDPDEPDKPRSWLWRVIRAALPFQMAIVALLCVACLLEPHCCDSINNLNLSLSPQLRYVRGPPPV